MVDLIGVETRVMLLAAGLVLRGGHSCWASRQVRDPASPNACASLHRHRSPSPGA